MPANFIQLRLLALLGVIFLCPRILPAQDWTRANAPTNANWYSVAVPAISGPMVAVVYGGGIYTSTNTGSSWEKTSAPNQNWFAIATSSDGSKSAAVVWAGGGVYTSIDSGTTWKKTGAPDINWASIASSFDGSKLATAAAGNWIYTSTDSGTNWHNNPSAPNTNWNTITTSSDGNKLAAVVYGGGVYTSTNAGAVWAKTSAPNGSWSCVASSVDGAKLAAGIKGGGIYTSTNAGGTWVKTSAPDTNWLSIASSETGRTLLAGGMGGGIYTSTNAGVSWEQTSAPIKDWYSVATSLHGSKFIAAAYGGGIYSWQMPVNQNVATPEDTAASFVLTAGHLDSTNLTYAILSNPANGSLGEANTNTGAVTYTPPPNYNGATSFKFRVYDGSFYSTGTVSITVTAVNDPPAANNQNITASEDVATALVLTASDVDNTNLTYSILSNPTNGSLSGLNTSSGAVTYLPSTNYNGSDSFTFTVYDGGFYSTGIVILTITAVNDAPLVNNQNITTPEDTIANLVLTASDVEGASLTYSIETSPPHGTLTELNPATGTVTYTPTMNYNGPDSFTFTAYDGSLYSTGRAGITVTAANDAPVANDQNVTTPEDTATNLVLTANDIDNASLTYIILSNPANGGLGGLNSNSGTVTYTPLPNFNGTDSFTFTAYDGSLYSTGTVSIMVTAVNDAPKANNQIVVTPEDTATNLTLTASDVDSSNLVYAILTGPINGTLIGLNPTNGTVTYAPATNYNGIDDFAFTVFDGVLYATGTVNITIAAVNDPPVAYNQSVVIQVNASTNLVIHGTDIENSNVVYWILVSPTNGTLTGINPTTGAVTYKPSTNYIGTDSFAFWVYDGSLFSTETGTVSITVTPVPVWLSLHYLSDSDALRFSWTNSAVAEFVLQQNADLNTTNWTDVVVTSTNDNNLIIATTPRSAEKMFFRLKH